jgi:sugar phosphate isomerase/epimerase
MTVSRRLFLGVAASALAVRADGFAPKLIVFSKHLPDLNYEELGKTAKELGFEGVDLTVRPKGHVLPERVAEDLPRAVDTLRQHGLSVPMITTEITSAADPVAIPTLRTASSLGIPFFKPGYWKYNDSPVEARVKEVGADVRRLAMLAAEHRITMGLHNHSGPYVGEAVWDTWEMIHDLDPRWTGFYYDPGHAAIEGGLGGHDVSLHLALPRLKMVAVKDFVWRKEASGWKSVWCPMGEGAVDWKTALGTLKQANYNGPISVHAEYQTKDMVGSLRKDLAFLKTALGAA